MSDIDALAAQLGLAKEHVNVAGGAGFDVGGLSLDSILRIFRRHSTELRELFDSMVSGDNAVSLAQASHLGGALLASAPHIAASVIAEAAGWDEDAVPLVRQVAAPVQLQALDFIARLTFTEEMPPKKVMETVARILGGVGKTLIGNDQP